jgi:cardiolipin synthase A/B
MPDTLISREFIKDNRNEILPPSWIEREHSSQMKGNYRDVLFTPGELKKRALSLIDSGMEMACICSFLIHDSDIEKAIVNASNRGVHVYILLSSEAKMDKRIFEDDDFSKKTLEEFNDTIRRLSPVVKIRSSANFHSKFIVIDPHGKNPQGMVLTSNLTKEALDKNPEIGVTLSETETRELYNHFRYGFNVEADKEVDDSGRHKVVTQKDRVDFDLYDQSTSLSFTTSNHTTILASLESLLEIKSGDITVFAYGFEPNHPTIDKIESLLKLGRKVTVFTRPRKGSKNFLDTMIRLKKAGAEIFGLNGLHAKGLLIGSGAKAQGIIMTANYEKKGLDEGFETAVRLNSERILALKEIFDDWKKMAEYRFESELKIGDIKGRIRTYQNSAELLEDIVVKERYDRQLKRIKAKDKKEAENKKPNIPMDSGEVGQMYHEMRFTWDVEIPEPPEKKSK